MNIESIKPHADNVLVRFDLHANARMEQLSPGGLVLPRNRDVARNEAVEATVIAVGPGYYADKFLDHERGTAPVGSTRFIPMDEDIKAGARVLVERPDIGDRVYSDERDEYRMIRAANVIAVLA